MPVNQHLLSQSADFVIEKAKGGGGLIFWGVYFISGESENILHGSQCTKFVEGQRVCSIFTVAWMRRLGCLSLSLSLCRELHLSPGFNVILEISAS